MKHENISRSYCFSGWQLFTLFLIIHLSTYPLAMANMASPIVKGTIMIEPFIAHNVEIKKEDIFINLDKNFEKASYHIHYDLNVSSKGNDVPMLFYAPEYSDTFSVFLDGKPIALQQFDDYHKEYVAIEQYFSPSLFENSDSAVNIKIPIGVKSEEQEISPSVLKFFRLNLDKANHIIDIYYTAKPYVDKREWVKTYIFRYALSPAKYWKSFENLNIYLDATAFSPDISTNIVAETFSGDIQKKAEWSMHNLPTEDMILISYKPEIPSLAQLLIRISPLGFALMLSVVLILLHFFAIAKYRQKNRNGLLWIKLLGILGIPLVAYISLWYFYELIYSIIGTHAAKMQGYGLVFAIVLVPLAIIIYAIIASVWDYYCSHKYKDKV